VNEKVPDLILNYCISGLKFPCDKCEYKAPLPHTLKQHKLTAHEASAYYPLFCKNKSFLQNMLGIVADPTGPDFKRTWNILTEGIDIFYL
jgi:hypothetical protein